MGIRLDIGAFTIRTADRMTVWSAAIGCTARFVCSWFHQSRLGRSSGVDGIVREGCVPSQHQPANNRLVARHFRPLITLNGAMDAPSHHPTNGSEPPELSRLEEAQADTYGGEIEEFDSAAHAAWCEKWAPKCPDGNPQRLRHPLAHRERNLCELELRVPLGRDEGGVCQLVVDEREDEVYVRVLVCVIRESDSVIDPREYVDCPVRVWLERPLGERVVIDLDTEQELPLRIPPYIRTIKEDGR